jgi:hypothetical protein
MTEDFDPLTLIQDEPLRITASTLLELREFRAAQKFTLLPGTNTAAEKARLSAVLHALTDRLLAGIEANPSKLWVMKEFRIALRAVEQEDTEAREHFGIHLEQLMDILGIESSDGLLNFYLVGIF